MRLSETRGLRVLHVIDSGGLYGAERVLLTLIGEQLKQGLAPVLCSIGERGAREKAVEREARARGFEIRAVRMRNGPNFPAALGLVRAVRRDGVRLLHLHGYKGNILFGFLPRRLRGLPAVSTLHGWTTTAGGGGRIRLYEWLDARVLTRLDRVVVVSRAMLDHPRLARRALRLDVVPNAVEPDDGQAPVPPGDPIRVFCERRPTIGSIGRLSVEKNHVALIEVLAALACRGNDVNLALLGDGPERERLQDLAVRRGVEDRVLFAGYVDDARRYLSGFALFALPSMTEGLPVTILEAMGSGTPIVATRVGGVGELLVDGSTAELVPPGDHAALEAAIVRLLDDPPRARAMAERARVAARAGRSAEGMAADYLAIYRQVLSACSTVS